MKTAIILHGMPSKDEYYNPESPSQSNKHWIPWIQRQLIIKDVLTQAIELPTPYAPIYKEWAKVFEQFNIDEETTLIGHSLGGGFLVRWLSENSVCVGKVALVAPAIISESTLSFDFLKFEIDSSLVEKTKSIKIFVSTDDDPRMIESADTLVDKIKGIEIQKFTDHGHFVESHMGTDKFPELLEYLIEE